MSGGQQVGLDLPSYPQSRDRILKMHTSDIDQTHSPLAELLAGPSNPIKVSMRINGGMAGCNWDECESAFDCASDPN